MCHFSWAPIEDWGPKRTQTYSPLPPRFSGWTGFMASHQPKLPPHQWDHITQENFLYLLERQTTFEIYSGWTHEWAFVFCLFFISSWGCKTEAASSFCVWKIPFFFFFFPYKTKVMKYFVYHLLYLWSLPSSLLLLFISSFCPPPKIFRD